jgi:hypothetical protein
MRRRHPAETTDVTAAKATARHRRRPFPPAAATAASIGVHGDEGVMRMQHRGNADAGLQYLPFRIYRPNSIPPSATEPRADEHILRS